MIILSKLIEAIVFNLINVCAHVLSPPRKVVQKQSLRSKEKEVRQRAFPFPFWAKEDDVENGLSVTT